ncbi:hypothetical protein TRSA_24170 (plasmid) [Treponema saccharophilum]|uniref:TM2 domain-containing protein n=2 Tax=Treponema saccharophilum TaxID=165 RepID=H7EH55_9SPIR|nr:hypothetical protein TresaDRAFT_2740 [Treponema saccharophilum DSM 2985]BDC97318.1 hypothetical protein TRSA_24170 [Treponema saccharophilum]
MPMGANDVYYCDECGRAIYPGVQCWSSEVTGGRADYGGDMGGRAKAFCSEYCLERAKARILGRSTSCSGSSSSGSSGRAYFTRKEFKKLEEAGKTLQECADAIGIKSDKNKWVTFVLCFFLGAGGAHQFYTGHIKKGFLYLFTGALFMVGWFVDIILILTNRFRDANQYLVK